MVTRFVQPNITSNFSTGDTDRFSTMAVLRCVVFATLLLFGATLLSPPGGAQTAELARSELVEMLGDNHAGVLVVREKAGLFQRVLRKI